MQCAYTGTEGRNVKVRKSAAKKLFTQCSQYEKVDNAQAGVPAQNRIRAESVFVQGNNDAPVHISLIPPQSMGCQDDETLRRQFSSQAATLKIWEENNIRDICSTKWLFADFADFCFFRWFCWFCWCWNFQPFIVKMKFEIWKYLPLKMLLPKYLWFRSDNIVQLVPKCFILVLLPPMI